MTRIWHWSFSLLGGLLMAASAVHGESAQLHNTSGLAFFYQGKDSQAFAEFVKSVEMDPGFSEPRFNLARLYERQKRYPEALQQYRDALQLDPRMTAAREGVDRLEKTLVERGRAPVVLPPGGLSPVAQTQQLAAIRDLIARGDVTEARSRLAILGQAMPSNADVVLMQAELAEKSGDQPAAVEWLGRALVLQPGGPDLYFRLARAQYRLGSMEPARLSVEKAIGLKPTQAEYFSLLGQIQESRGKSSEAFNAYNEAARLDPKSTPDRARADELSRKLGLYYYNAGLFYFQQKAWTKSRDALKLAIEKANLNPEQMAIAQQYMVISEFSAAKVADQIRDIQEARKVVDVGQVSQRVLIPETEGRPVSFPKGRYVEFLGWIIARKDLPNATELLCTRNFREVEAKEHRFRDGEGDEGGFRSNTRMENWFTLRTPRPMPQDPRIAPSSRITVKGQLEDAAYIKNPYNFSYSLVPKPTVKAHYVEIYRERRTTFREEEFDRSNSFQVGEVERRVDRREPRPGVNTPPGLSGALRIDYLKFTEEQRKNMEPLGEF